MPDRPTISDRMDEKFKDVDQTYLSKSNVPSDPLKVDDYFEDVAEDYEFKTEQKINSAEMQKRTNEKTLKPKS